MSVAAGGGKASRFFALAPPTHGQQPTRVKRKAGFDAAPKKVAPKPQFSSAATKRTAADDEGESKADAKLPEPRVIAWLRAGNADRQSAAAARTYLLRGAPFLGDSDYDSKETIKEAGARWVPNPAKQRGARDGVTPGWWSAYDERTLEALLALPKVAKTRRDGNEWQAPAWKPFDCPGKNAAEGVAELLNEFSIYTKVRDGEEREALQRAQTRREEALRARDALAGAGGDDPADVAALRAEYDVEWAEELRRAADRATVLGPTSGISSVARVLRGLRLEIVFKEQVRVGRLVDSVYGRDARPATRGTPNAKRAVTMRADDDGPMRDYNQLPPDAPVILYGTSHPFMVRPRSNKEWEDERLAEKEAAVAQTVGPEWREHRDTRCSECTEIVLQQFGGCCACAEPREWVECAKCGTSRCQAHQWCACRFGWEAWTTLQEKAAREHAARVEEANQQAALANALSEMGVGGSSVRGDDEDDEDCGQAGGAFRGWFVEDGSRE